MSPGGASCQEYIATRSHPCAERPQWHRVAFHPASHLLIVCYMPQINARQPYESVSWTLQAKAVCPPRAKGIGRTLSARTSTHVLHSPNLKSPT